MNDIRENDDDDGKHKKMNSNNFSRFNQQQQKYNS